MFLDYQFARIYWYPIASCHIFNEYSQSNAILYQVYILPLLTCYTCFRLPLRQQAKRSLLTVLVPVPLSQHQVQLIPHLDRSLRLVLAPWSGDITQ